MTQIRNVPLDALEVGQSARLTREIRTADIRAAAALAGNFNPHHVDRDLAADPAFQALLGRTGLGVSLILTLVATELPGPGTVVRHLSLDCEAPIAPGDEITARVEVADIGADGAARLTARCTHADGTVAVSGHLDVTVPEARVDRPFGRPPDFHLAAGARADRFEQLERQARDAGPLRMAVVHPVDGPSLEGALESAGAGLIEAVLVGPRKVLEAAAADIDRDLADVEIVEAGSAEEAAACAVQLAAEGEVEGLMKGALHTDTLMHAVVCEKGLRGSRRISHVFAVDVPSYDRLLFVSDAAVNVSPDLSDLRDIVQNTIHLARALTIARPRIAILSAVETVSEDIQSTIRAAALCKMADRGEITGGELDGPLAMDNAVSEQAAEIKGLTSPVAGRADALIVPDLISGNILVKDLDYLAGAEAAGVVMGARVPVALTSRADSARERRASAALACLVARA